MKNMSRPHRHIRPRRQSHPRITRHMRNKGRPANHNDQPRRKNNHTARKPRQSITGNTNRLVRYKISLKRRNDRQGSRVQGTRRARRHPHQNGTLRPQRNNRPHMNHRMKQGHGQGYNRSRPRPPAQCHHANRRPHRQGARHSTNTNRYNNRPRANRKRLRHTQPNRSLPSIHPPHQTNPRRRMRREYRQRRNNTDHRRI